jgi:hypothetical protein
MNINVIGHGYRYMLPFTKEKMHDYRRGIEEVVFCFCFHILYMKASALDGWRNYPLVTGGERCI